MGIALSDASRTTAGILLLTVVAIEYGGTFMLQVVRGRHALTHFQQTFFRAGHAHAGVLVILALVAQLLVDATTLTGVAESVARSGVPLGAILVPGGFFFSATGRDVTRPNRFVWLLYGGVVAVAAGVVTLGVGLLTA